MNLSSRAQLGLRAFQGLAFAGLLAYALQAETTFCGSGAETFFEDYVYTALILAGGTLCLVRAAVERRERAAWLVLGLGIVAWGGAEIYYSAFLDGPAEPPIPSVSDGLWLAFFPACYVAMVLLARARIREFRASLWLDGLVGTLAAAAVASAFVIGPITGGGADPSAVGLDLAFLLGDLLLLGMVIGVFALTGWRPDGAWGLLGIGLVVGAAVDGYFLYDSAMGGVAESTVLATLWPFSAVLVGCAAWRKPTRVPLRLEGWRVMALPAAFALAALAVLGAQAFTSLEPVAVGLAAATLVATILRLSVTFRENLRLLEGTRREALTDALTGLANRRRLMLDLESAVPRATLEEPCALVLFDLDGFKLYNDRFGHPLGDALLARLGRSLAEAVRGRGRAYRLGGDEFCVIARGSEEALSVLAARARDALSDQGRGFMITSSYGMVLLPREAQEVSHALHVADDRLYEDKAPDRRGDASRETSEALMQVLRECEPALDGHMHEVGGLTRALAVRLGLDGASLKEVARAAELHDIGKVAVPRSILHKPAPLDDGEWEFVRQHTLVGDRILSAAPALNTVAKIVRASHEWYDGSGYPDGASGDEIPIGARIVAICDAYNAMTSERPYQKALTEEEALEELRRCAGTQFDPDVVHAFCSMLEPAVAAAHNGNGHAPVRALAPSPSRA